MAEVNSDTPVSVQGEAAGLEQSLQVVDPTSDTTPKALTDAPPPADTSSGFSTPIAGGKSGSRSYLAQGASRSGSRHSLLNPAGSNGAIVADAATAAVVADVPSTDTAAADEAAVVAAMSVADSTAATDGDDESLCEEDDDADAASLHGSVIAPDNVTAAMNSDTDGPSAEQQQQASQDQPSQEMDGTVEVASDAAAATAVQTGSSSDLSALESYITTSGMLHETEILASEQPSDSAAPAASQPSQADTEVVPHADAGGDGAVSQSQVHFADLDASDTTAAAAAPTADAPAADATTDDQRHFVPLHDQEAEVADDVSTPRQLISKDELSMSVQEFASRVQLPDSCDESLEDTANAVVADDDMQPIAAKTGDMQELAASQHLPLSRTGSCEVERDEIIGKPLNDPEVLEYAKSQHLPFSRGASGEFERDEVAGKPLNDPVVMEYAKSQHLPLSRGGSRQILPTDDEGPRELTDDEINEYEQSHHEFSSPAPLAVPAVVHPVEREVLRPLDVTETILAEFPPANFDHMDHAALLRQCYVQHRQLQELHAIRAQEVDALSRSLATARASNMKLRDQVTRIQGKSMSRQSSFADGLPPALTKALSQSSVHDAITVLKNDDQYAQQPAAAAAAAAPAGQGSGMVRAIGMSSSKSARGSRGFEVHDIEKIRLKEDLTAQTLENERLLEYLQHLIGRIMEIPSAIPVLASPLKSKFE
ncbi:hypothetical protein BC828DRAFT_374762 [Blastocladiella britannica]|nr:hypothetical protein BC828DRAFT_374762 [Blastocladiella britannica]